MEKENRIFTLRMGLLIPVAILYCIAAAEAIVGLISFDIDAYWEMLIQMEMVWLCKKILMFSKHISITTHIRQHPGLM